MFFPLHLKTGLTFLFLDIQPLLNLTRNVTSCGISPFLNSTLLNYTAHNNFIPYRNYSEATIWSWESGEPRNDSTSDVDDRLFRCASISLQTGRWSVSDCSSKYPAACRSITQPYNWTLTDYDISYSFARQVCPDDYEFAVPRTALENSYLTQRLGNGKKEGQGSKDDTVNEGRVWLDLNALDFQGCWVTGGPNATCPYSNTVGFDSDMEKRTILVCYARPEIPSCTGNYRTLILASGTNYRCRDCPRGYCTDCLC